MKEISEKVSYLQGLSEGLNVNEKSPQGKILNGVLAVLSDMADEMEDIQVEMENIKDYLDSIDEDLFELEESWLNSEEDYPEHMEQECPNCGETVYFYSSLMDDKDVLEIICPKCNEHIFINEGAFDYEPAFIDDELGTDNPDLNNPSPS